MKGISFVLMTGCIICLILFSFNSCTSGQPNSTTDLEPIPSASYKAILVKNHISSYAIWKEAYMSHDSLRKAYGITSQFIARGSEDTNAILVMNRMNDVQKGKDFGASPDLKSAMEKAGVTGPPLIAFVDVIRDDTSSIPQKDRVMVVHRVKDFDAWIKVFDEEGRAQRVENGLLDRGLAREIDDSNMVYIVFAIADKTKAMARMQTEELKKLMVAAGVEGPPSFFFYTLQN